MLINTTPDVYLPIPNTWGASLAKYIFINPESAIPGKVLVGVSFYKDDDAFFANTRFQSASLGTIDFDINSAGLRDALEAYVITFFPSFQHCGVPVPPAQDAEE